MTCETRGYPRKSLPIIRWTGLSAKARNVNPKKNIAVSKSNVFFLPIISLKHPANKADSICPRVQQLAKENSFTTNDKNLQK